MPRYGQLLGAILAEKLNASQGPVTVALPLQGVSMIDAPGQPFWWPEANQTLFKAIRTSLRADIPVVELDCNINDPAFAECCARSLLQELRQGASSFDSSKS
jgi:uncharacterized protein (UPF0261 family)